MEYLKQELIVVLKCDLSTIIGNIVATCMILTRRNHSGSYAQSNDFKEIVRAGKATAKSGSCRGHEVRLGLFDMLIISMPYIYLVAIN